MNRPPLTPLENLHYAIGLLAYAVAFADGEVQKEERREFYNFITQELQRNHLEFEVSETVFAMLDKHNSGKDEMYSTGIKQLRANSHHLSPDLKASFIELVEKVGAAYQLPSSEEALLLDQIRAELLEIEGDPRYFRRR